MIKHNCLIEVAIPWCHPLYIVHVYHLDALIIFLRQSPPQKILFKQRIFFKKCLVSK